MKKVLIISSSLRLHSNSEMLTNEFARGAKEAGNEVEIVTLRGKEIAFCRGCLACQKTQQCVIDDDARAIVNSMCEADVIVFATPIYYYEMCGQLKTLLDRSNPLYTAEYRFRDIYLLTAAAEEGSETPSGAITGLEGWIACFEHARLSGTVFAGGVTVPGEAQNRTAMMEAYTMGQSIQ